MGQSHACKDKVERQGQPFLSHNAKAIRFFLEFVNRFRGLLRVLTSLTLSLRILSGGAKTRSMKSLHPVSSPAGKPLRTQPIPQIILTNWREMLHQSGLARRTQ